MSDLLVQAAQTAFAYPTQPHERRHGPRGYADAKLYKPWLRDEFSFRCVYCLLRERWEPNGQAVFGVDHFQSRASSPAQLTDYGNLLYACCQCNASRQDSPLPFDPCQEPLANHLTARREGTVEPLSADGRKFIRICHLNRPLLVEYRRHFLDLANLFITNRDPAAEASLRFLLGLPSDLPALRSKRPPGGNARPEG